MCGDARVWVESAGEGECVQVLGFGLSVRTLGFGMSAMVWVECAGVSTNVLFDVRSVDKRDVDGFGDVARADHLGGLGLGLGLWVRAKV